MKIKNKSIKNILPIILCIAILTTTIIIVKNNNQSPSNGGIIENLPIYPKFKNKQKNTLPEGEMRAIWVPFMDLNVQSNCTQENFKEKFDKILSVSKSHGINTMIVHVRSHGDALYKSSIYPWSHILTGTQGADPGFDPLEYMVNSTHDAGMTFHAWVNPLRIQLNNAPEILSDSNPYNIWRNDDDPKHNLYVLDWNGNKYYNPAYPEVRSMLINGIAEIIENYPVDGIHFDDYFYPTESPDLDKTSYDEYISELSPNSTALSLIDWRITNINSLITGVYSKIKSVNKNLQFGISPQCNIDNDIKMGADVYSWGSKKGYVDYLCPQIYVNFENPILTFDKSFNDWKSIIKRKETNLYIGLALYKANSGLDKESWKKSNNIIKTQVEYSRNLGCNGFMLYSWSFLENEQTKEEMKNLDNLFLN